MLLAFIRKLRRSVRLQYSRTPEPEHGQPEPATALVGWV